MKPTEQEVYVSDEDGLLHSFDKANPYTTGKITIPENYNQYPHKPGGGFAPGHMGGVNSKGLNALKRAMVDAISPGDMFDLSREVYTIAMEDKDPRVRLEAAKMLWDRLLGKPATFNATQVAAHITHDTTGFDPSKLSDAELQTALGLFDKMTALPPREREQITINPSELGHEKPKRSHKKKVN